MRELDTIDRMPGELIVIGPILLLWLPMSRVPRIRRLIAVVLAVLIALAATLVHLLPRAVLEITLGGLVLALVTVLSGHLMEPRPTAAVRRTRVAVPAGLLAGWLLLVLCCGAIAVRPAPFFPTTDDVLPLPAGLRATAHPFDDGDCGSGACFRTITVSGRPGQSGADLYAELKRHVKAHGWGDGCRPVGWLLDHTTKCAELSVKDDRATITLSGSRDDDRHMVTIG
ncbi:hypothetical protein [Actinoplanes sp. NPDC026623]|uniref:hypothetical protein n=1 Tax=Actinoplanes sp. NPDC026623 TaxID=3155610 RepID=UPI00340C8CB1